MNANTDVHKVNTIIVNIVTHMNTYMMTDWKKSDRVKRVPFDPRGRSTLVGVVAQGYGLGCRSKCPRPASIFRPAKRVPWITPSRKRYHYKPKTRSRNFLLAIFHHLSISLTNVTRSTLPTTTPGYNPFRKLIA